MRRTLAFPLLAFVLGICLSDSRPAAAQSWPMYQVDASHTGYMPVSLTPGQFYVRWSTGIGVAPGGSYLVNPVAAGDGRVYASLRIYFKDVTQLFALSTADGSTLWSRSFGSINSVNPPAYANGIVYLQTGNHSSDTWLWALDGGSGTKIFQVPHSAQWERYYAPTVFEGRVYVDGGYYGGMYGFRGSNGDQLWFTGLPQYDEWTPAVDASRAYTYLGDSPGYAAGLYIKKLVDGTAAQPVGFIPDPDFEWDGWSMDQAPVLGGAGEVLAINRPVLSKPGRLIAFNPSSGTIAWQLKDKYTGQPSVAGGRIYAVNNGGLSVLDESLHTLLWSWMPPQPPGGSRAITQPMIVTDTHVLVSTQDTVYAVDLTTHDALWSFAAANAKLAIADGTLFVAGGDGFLTAIALRSNVKPTSINPNTGPSIGGTPVTITGSGFQAGVTVMFGGNAATVASVTSSQILATTPPHAAGPVDVVIINPDLDQGRLLGAFTYTCGATAPTAAVSGTATICSGSSTNLTVALTGTGPWKLYWSDGFVQSGVGASPATRTVSPSATTTYTVATVADANCASTASGSATVTANPVPSATIAAPAAVCQNAGGLAASVPNAGSGTTYVWTITNGTITSGAGTNAVVFSAGVASPIQLGVTVTLGGCSKSGSANVSVSPIATATVSGSAAICAGTSTTIQAALTGVAPWTVTWSDGVVQSGVAASPATRSVSPAASTSYSVTAVTDATGCAGTRSGLADIVVKPTPPALITPNAAQVCPGSTGNVASTVDAGAGATYVWTVTNGTVTAGAGTRQITFTAGAAGSVTLGVTTTASNGCSSTDTRVWTILPNPTAALTGPATACSGLPTNLTLNLTGQPPWNLRWSDGFVQTIQTSPATRAVTLAADATFSLTSLTDGSGCNGTVSGSVSLAVRQAPTASVSGDGTVCSGDPATISAAVTATGPFTARWNDGVVQTGTGSTTLTRVVSPGGSTFYKIDAIFDAYCSVPGLGGAMVTVGLGPAAAMVTAPGSLCAGASGAASVPDAGAGAKYTWSLFNGTIDAGQGTRAVTFTAGDTSPAHLTVVVQGASGCQIGGAWDVTVDRRPPAPSLTAPAHAVSGESGLVASVAASGADVFTWTVENGTLTSGQGTSTITFAAGVPGVTTVSVAQKTGRGCASEAPVRSIPISGFSAIRIVPVVVSVTGAGGAQFSSELTFANPGGSNAHVELTLTPADSLGGGASATVGQDIGPGRQLVIPDALAFFAGQGAARAAQSAAASGGGSVVAAFTNLPAHAVVFGAARTTAASGPGRAGLAYPAPAAEDFFNVRVAVYGLRETAAERSNLALENAGASGPVGLRVTLVSGTGDARFVLPDVVFLRPGQWVQIGSVLKAAGFTSGWALVERVSGTDPFYAYGVANDNVTNDGAFLAAVPAVRPASAQVVPSVVETPTFGTELVLVNPGSASATATLNFIESLASPLGNSTGFVTETLKPGEQRFIPDLVAYLRTRGASPGAKGASYAGPLFVRFSSGGVSADGFVASRTSAPAAGGGVYGVSYAGVPLAETATSSAWVFGLQQNAASRSNLGLLNAATNLGTISLRYDVFDGATGSMAGGATVSLSPGQWVQVNMILKTHGLANGYVRVTRTAGTAPWVAYGVLNDGAAPGAGTGDGSFIGMTTTP